MSISFLPTALHPEGSHLPPTADAIQLLMDQVSERGISWVDRILHSVAIPDTQSAQCVAEALLQKWASRIVPLEAFSEDTFLSGVTRQLGNLDNEHVVVVAQQEVLHRISDILITKRFSPRQSRPFYA